MRRLGIDPGQRRVGLALCDEEGQLAYPHATLPGAPTAQLARALAREAEGQKVGEVVLGLPLSMNGQEGPAARKVRRLAAALEAVLGARIPVVLWDERLTTVSAHRQLRASGVSGPKQRKVVDQAAATILLQSYLDAAVHREGGQTP